MDKENEKALIYSAKNVPIHEKKPYKKALLGIIKAINTQSVALEKVIQLNIDDILLWTVSDKSIETLNVKNEEIIAILKTLAGEAGYELNI